MKSMIVLKLGTAFGVFVSVALCQVPPTLTVQGIRGTSATLSISDIEKLTQQTIKTTDHGTAVTFEGVLLARVLAQVRTPAGEGINQTVASFDLSPRAL